MMSKTTTQRANKDWHILFSFPTLAGFYLVWFIYFGLVYWTAGHFLFNERLQDKFNEHKQLLPYALLSIVTTDIAYLAFPIGSALNISGVCVARFVFWIYSCVTGEAVHFAF